MIVKAFIEETFTWFVYSCTVDPGSCINGLESRSYFYIYKMRFDVSYLLHLSSSFLTLQSFLVHLELYTSCIWHDLLSPDNKEEELGFGAR